MRLQVLFAIIVAGLLCPAGRSLQAAQSPLIGRPVAEVLAEARDVGIVVVFNTQVVPATLTVLAEPKAAGGVAQLEEILASHGLALQAVGSGAYAVVRVDASAAAGAGQAVTPAQAVTASVVTLEEIVVTTSRYVLGGFQPGSYTPVPSDVLQSMPRLGEETLQAVQRLPGVAAAGFGARLQVRGGEADETLIRLDGLTLYEPFHLKNFLSPVSLLDARFIGSLDFHSGGFGAAFGDRMSAVVDARSLALPAGHRFEVGLSLLHATALANGMLADGRGTWLVSMRQSNLGRALDAFETDIGNPEYEDGFARATLAVGDATQVTASLLLSRDEIEFSWEPSGERAFAGYRNVYAWTTVEHAFGEALTARLLAGYTTVDNDRLGTVDDPGRRTGSVTDRRHFDVAGVALDFTWRPTVGVHQWGLEANALDSDYRYHSRVQFAPNPLFPALSLAPAVRSLAGEPDGWQSAAYYTSRFTLGPAWVVEAGVRADAQTYTDVDDSAEVNPRVGLMYTPHEATRLRASWGRYAQQQRINELQLEDGIDRFLPAQHARHAVIGIDHDWSAALTTRLEAYRKDYSNLKPRYENLFDVQLLLPELSPDRVVVAPSSARVRGVEASLAWRPSGPWSAWFNYSWSEARDRVAGRHVPRSWDQRHAISAGLRWARGDWDVTLAQTWHSGWPTTPVSPGGASAVGERNTARLDGFASLDLHASRWFRLPRGRLETFVEITNVTDESNECCIDYRVISAPGGPDTVSPVVNDWLGIVPSIGVRWQY